MKTILKKNEIVSKVFNNNIILVNSEKNEKILFAKGIGFGKKIGSIIPKGKEIDKVFTIENKENIADFKEVVMKIDSGFFAVCEEAIYEISKQLDCELNERIHIGLIDHLFIAVERLKNNNQIENPFLAETETLYEREFELSKMVAKMIEEYSNVILPDGEIGFIALHIHSSINNGKISNTIKNTRLSTRIVELVEEKMGVEINKKSLDYARFCTHIKFAIQRIMKNTAINNELSNMIKETYKDSYSIAEEAAEIIEDELNIKVLEDEIASLTIHIERFRVSTK